MLYTMKVYALLATIVFGATGTFLLTYIALSAARDYARALREMQRIASGIRRDSFAISRTPSRNHEPNSPHAA
jgi:hypothetical protein